MMMRRLVQPVRVMSEIIAPVVATDEVGFPVILLIQEVDP